MAGLRQQVVCTVDVAPCGPASLPIHVEETLAVTHKNVHSKVREWMAKNFMFYNTMGGATFKVVLKPCEPDEFANPER